MRQLQRRLAAVLHDAAQHRSPLLLAPNEGDHVLRGERLEIQPVGGVVIGADGLGVAVDHDGLEPRLAQCIGSVDAAIVELDPLADAVRPAAQDHDLLPVAGIGLADRRAETALVGRVHVGRGRGKLARAGVDTLIDGLHAEPLAQPGDRRRSRVGEAGKLDIGKAHRLDAAHGMRVAWQPVAEDRLLGRDNRRQFAQEPEVEMTGGVDLLDRQAGAQRLRCHQQSLGARRGEGGAKGICPAIARHCHRIEAGEAGLHAAQTFLQRLGEAAADRHALAHRFHAGGQQRRRAGELLEGEARDLHHHVVDGRLEAGRRGAGDVVGQLVERVADRKLRRDLGDGKAGGLGGEGGGARDARVHLDHHHPPVGRVDRELHIAAAGIDADAAQARDGGIAHPLVFSVGECQRRSHGDTVAGMHAHRIDVLDGADDDAVVRAVANHLHLELLPAEHAFLDQHLVRGRGVEAPLHDAVELLAVIGDAAAGAPQGEAGPDHRGQPDSGQGRAGFLQGVSDGAARAFQADLAHCIAELLAILGALDHLGAGADQLHAVFLQHAVGGKLEGGIEGCLPAHRRQQRIRFLAGDDAFEKIGRDRLDIGGVRQTGIGHDGGGVGVHQDGAEAFLAQRLAGLGAGIIELASLTDDDRARADDENGVDVGAAAHYRGSIIATNRWNRCPASLGPGLASG